CRRHWPKRYSEFSKLRSDHQRYQRQQRIATGRLSRDPVRDEAHLLVTVGAVYDRPRSPITGKWALTERPYSLHSGKFLMPHQFVPAAVFQCGPHLRFIHPVRVWNFERRVWISDQLGRVGFQRSIREKIAMVLENRLLGRAEAVEVRANLADQRTR